MLNFSVPAPTESFAGPFPTMNCHLLVPGLFWPPAADPDPYQGLALPGLERLLTRGRWQRAEPRELAAWLCSAFGVARQQDWPVAPLTLTLDGKDPGAAYWLRADPIHLQADRDRLVLAAAELLSIDEEEAQALGYSLNQHFSVDGFEFHCPHPHRWYLRLPQAPRLVTRELSQAVGRSVEDFLPTGEDAQRWRAILNEIQMLLHTHPVNEAREARGELPVNSVWLWGGGNVPPKPVQAYRAVWADEPLARALAALSGANHEPLPRVAGEWLARSISSGDALLVLDTLRGFLEHGDPGGWRQEIEQLDRDWFVPLIRALARRGIAKLVLHPLPLACRIEATARDLQKFWRRSRPLRGFACAHVDSNAMGR